MNDKNNYGFKVYYCEKDKKRFVRYCICNTYGLAEFTVKASMRYPPTARKDGHTLKNPQWKIVPITKKKWTQVYGEIALSNRRGLFLK
jgi:hypothetical protein